MGCNIAIDGPAGAGKSTIAKKVAKELSFIYVDTGAMYRAMALYLLNHGVNGENQEEIEAVCSGADISIEYKNGEQIVILNGENVNAMIRTEQVGNMASKSSANPKVRAHLLKLQRTLAEKNDVVMDGRDIGTTILPNAEVKIYLTASADTRAKRRALEYEQKGESFDLDQIRKDIIERDERDMNREISPLKQADVNAMIRTEQVGNMASKSSANPKVRAHLLKLQRTLAEKNDVVMDGRDIGTTILPNAEVKIYLTASVDTRAKRRALEYEQKGESFDLDQIRKDIIERDERDMNREISPLKQAEDAVLVDSSEMGIDDVVNAILNVYKEKVQK